MAAQTHFDAMADACVSLHAQVMVSGTPEMRILVRMLLLALAQEIQRREARSPGPGSANAFN